MFSEARRRSSGIPSTFLSETTMESMYPCSICRFSMATSKGVSFMMRPVSSLSKNATAVRATPIAAAATAVAARIPGCASAAAIRGCRYALSSARGTAGAIAQYSA